MIVILDYGAGNIASISSGFKKIGAQVKVTSNPGELEKSDAIVLPGVGSFGDAMQKISKYEQVLREEVGSGKPFLGVCLGIQLLMQSSDESPGITGLGFFKGTCKRLDTHLKVPHMGWNTIQKIRDTPLLEGIDSGDFLYFVHSYHVVPNEVGVVAAETQYDTLFPSVISLKNIHATQFHPEKSAEKGIQILKNFANMIKK
jgi:imidazole glycerol-phosphate synthase subunit HisH